MILPTHRLGNSFGGIVKVKIILFKKTYEEMWVTSGRNFWGYGSFFSFNSDVFEDLKNGYASKLFLL